MGLILSTSMNNRTGEYWRINRLEHCLNEPGGEKLVNVEIALFEDKAARDAQEHPIGHRSYSFTGADYTNIFDAAGLDPVDMNHIKRAYERVKVQTDFNGATDDL